MTEFLGHHFPIKKQHFYRTDLSKKQRREVVTRINECDYASILGTYLLSIPGPAPDGFDNDVNLDAVIGNLGSDYIRLDGNRTDIKEDLRKICEEVTSE